MCHNSSACHVYIMWAEFGHCSCLYVPAVLNAVTTGNGTSTKNVLKWNREFGLSLVSSKPILYLDTFYCKFLLYVRKRRNGPV